ncbi:phosphate ABC transporter substrate-binding protein [Laspinema palackyanum]|uniref:phosphate ABC transporter substrate-binding protein n=1 Tax=Laspinema palackyanum TaxID=3231601 RepID=UPI00345C9453|nr:phosphate ABC transporter substrate-binding protein [Laspinema sp. D2c]
MANKTGPSPILYFVAFLILAAVGYWFLSSEEQTAQITPNGAIAPPAQAPATSEPSTSTAPPPSALPSAPLAPTQARSYTFSLPASVPGNTSVRIDGSTSMVTINQNLKQGFERQYAGTNILTVANGTERGIQAVQEGNADLAAISRSLTPQEKAQGLAVVAIASDRIALVVGIENPYTSGLTQEQVRQIFQGQITNWQEIGGPAGPIQVLNRPRISGTHQAFQEIVLNGGNFGNSANITTLKRDETTGMLRQLGRNGIGYATFAQVANQQTVKTLPIDGMMPDHPNYPLQRVLSYAYQQPPNPAVQAFLGYATSPQGQQSMLSGSN